MSASPRPSLPSGLPHPRHPRPPPALPHPRQLWSSYSATPAPMSSSCSLVCPRHPRCAPSLATTPPSPTDPRAIVDLAPAACACILIRPVPPVEGYARRGAALLHCLPLHPYPLRMPPPPLTPRRATAPPPRCIVRRPLWGGTVLASPTFLSPPLAQPRLPQHRWLAQVIIPSSPRLEFLRTLSPDAFKSSGHHLQGGSVEAAMGDLTGWQEWHAMLVLSKAKELAKIRYDLRPRHMKDKQYWRIYFLLANSYTSPYELCAIQKEKVRRMETKREAKRCDHC